MESPEYQKHLIIALQQQRDQAHNQIAHLAAVITVRDAEIAELKANAEKPTEPEMQK